MIDEPWTAGGALFSKPQSKGARPKYRYSLERWWGPPDKYVLWVLINPSTATATEPDDTVRCVIERSRRRFPEVDGLRIVNLFAWIDSKPRNLKACGYDVAVGNPENDAVIRALSAQATRTVVGWGEADGVPREWLRNRERDIAPLLVDPVCLGLTKESEQPRHPKPQNSTQLPMDAGFEPWRPRR